MGGCIAAGWLKINKPNLKVVVIEPATLGGAFKNSGLKYLRWDDHLASIVTQCGVAAVKQPVKGGVLVSAPPDAPVAWDYPGDMDERMVQSLQEEHYSMTRGTMEGFTYDVMNFGGREQFKMVTTPMLCEALTADAQVIQSMISRIYPSDGSCYLKIGGGQMIEAGMTLWTPHLAFLARMMDETSIQTNALTLNVMVCEAMSEWWATHDYVYTSTCAKKVHRISATDPIGSVQAEWNGEGLSEDVLSDLEAMDLLPRMDTHKPLPGHLLPLSNKDKKTIKGWESHGIRPLGRFAEWDGRATVDKNIYKLMEVFSETR